MRYYYIVAAAGIGKRMRLDYPKQFLEYKGKPIFITTVEEIEKNSKVTDIIIVTNKDYIKEVKEMIKKYRLKKVKEIVAGGKERQDSIYNGLKLIDDNDSIVGIQDGVRPFIKQNYIDEGYKKLNKNSTISGVVVGVKVKDTIKEIDKNKNIVNTPKREKLIAAQTPQIFRTQILKKAYESAFENDYYGTDDSSLMEYIGEKIEIIEGNYNNIKITTPEDLVFLKQKE
ncbi:2-C-methyl-D-erythritol 4-phosphate cytidylyltransferase [Haliovirga abyssi]|uniref:2-C-methyl-D-erythritol 4-phosphate cytidylyltransferase n=1 Tax=Haliovirga abyssi TaxID=2996794 RepID=A0AAU9DFI7_9FUSO|nr:2-C-methyl-D-erythritol 4-phosphate cytidylyltransferase [Haliovirga abyssi]BDU51182.1 2-C-methyl-D-erythritol 4-phosphate cytidylyltransferase [Haliovirga abyssi]